MDCYIEICIKSKAHKVEGLHNLELLNPLVKGLELSKVTFSSTQQLFQNCHVFKQTSVRCHFSCKCLSSERRDVALTQNDESVLYFHCPRVHFTGLFPTNGCSKQYLLLVFLGIRSLWDPFSPQGLLTLTSLKSQYFMCESMQILHLADHYPLYTHGGFCIFALRLNGIAKEWNHLWSIYLKDMSWPCFFFLSAVVESEKAL